MDPIVFIMFSSPHTRETASNQIVLSKMLVAPKTSVHKRARVKTIKIHFLCRQSSPFPTKKKICFLSQTKQGSESPRPRVSLTIISFGVLRAVMNGARTRANLSCYDMSAALTIISKLENQHMAGVFVQLRLFDFSLSISKTTYIHTPSMRLLPFCIDLEMSLWLRETVSQ